MKRYLRLSKKYAVFELRYPMWIICVRRGTDIAIEVNVSTITKLYKYHTRTLQEVVCIEKNKCKHKFVNYVTVNYVTTLLLKSKCLSKCVH